jgi:hypothetical protein
MQMAEPTFSQQWQITGHASLCCSDEAFCGRMTVNASFKSYVMSFGCVAQLPVVLPSRQRRT